MSDEREIAWRLQVHIEKMLAQPDLQLANHFKVRISSGADDSTADVIEILVDEHTQFNYVHVMAIEQWLRSINTSCVDGIRNESVALHVDMEAYYPPNKGRHTGGGRHTTFAVGTTAGEEHRAVDNVKSVPQGGEKLLYWLLPKEHREYIPGDLAEEFFTVVLPKFGLRYARWWYWRQVVASTGPILRNRLRKLLAIGSLLAVAERVWRQFGS